MAMEDSEAPRQASQARRPDPSEFKISRAGAGRLAQLSGLALKELAGRSIGELQRAFPFQIDPEFLFMRRVCGTVVKTDPVTGIDYPVPFATVQVEDTDCSFLGYFPPLSPWSWFFPFNCRREVIATTTTDECGRFCVWIPRFDIDWVLRWRHQRICLPIVFERPNWLDIIEHLIPEREVRFPPRPWPDPGPLLFSQPLEREMLIEKVRKGFGEVAAARIERLTTQQRFGADASAEQAALFAPAMLDNLAPPLPEELRQTKREKDRIKEGADAGLSTVAHRIGIDPRDLQGLDLRRYIGPFKRCHDIFVPVWSPVIDVPDITFRVLQDVDGDGDLETIYSEGYFQVRWNSGPIPDLVLHAGPQAVAGRPCGHEPVACADQPAIVLAGRLPVTGDPSTFDNTTGYALRTNRPHPSGTFEDPTPLTAAASPLRGLLSLFGCNRTDASATHYRLTYQYSSDSGASFGSRTPFVGYSWPLFRLNGLGVGEYHFPVADSLGWYPIALPGGPNAWLPQDLLLDWPSQTKADGVYRLRLELGSAGSTTPSSFSDEVSIVVDNSTPGAILSVEYGPSQSGPFTPLDPICPVVRRGATPQDVYFRVRLDASAQHLRSSELWGIGCGSGSMVIVQQSGGYVALGGSYRHWHQSAGDNSQTFDVVYRLSSGAAQGTYGFGAHVSSRAFNPYNGGHLATPPWELDTDEAYTHVTTYFTVANINP